MLKESQEQTAPRVPQEPQEPRELQVPPDLKVLQEPKLDPTALSRVPRVIPAYQEKTEQMEKEVFMICLFPFNVLTSNFTISQRPQWVG